MLTTKPFSTISYNSAEFLVLKLNEMLKAREISFWAFVGHYAERDEGKNHIHLYVVPDKRIQTSQFVDAMKELDVSNPLAPPLGVMPCQSSKFADWFLYASHDSAYLLTKGQKREYHYTTSDFATSHEDYFHELVHTIDRTKYYRQVEILEKMKTGSSLEDLVRTGQIPIAQLSQWERAFHLMQAYDLRLARNERKTHSPLDET